MIMIERLAARVLLVILSLGVATPLRSAEPGVRPAASDQAAAVASSTNSTNPLRLITPGPMDGEIASVTARMLEHNHYLKMPFNDAVSSKFLDRYMETLDPMHLHFTQGDVAEFERYRTNLAHLTINAKRRGEGDATPGCEIFNRFLERVSQRVAYADELLKQEKFTFDGDDRILINRKESPYPEDLNAAKKLWRERLRFEYLQELLGKIGARKKNVAALKNRPLSAETNGVVKAPEPPQAAKTDVATTARVPPPFPPVPPLVENRRPLLLPSPKDAERAAALANAAGKARAQAELDLQAQPQLAATENKRAETETEARSMAEARAKAEQEKQPAQTAAAPPKKTDDEEIIDTLTHRYHRNLRFFTDWDSDDVIQVYLTALAHVYDPHSDYLGRRQLEQFSIAMNLSLFGIGAELVSEEGYCKIRRLLPGGPAIKSKLIKENDRIVAVAQSNQPPVDVVEMSLNKAVQLIRGPKGTEVRLTVIPAGAETSTRTVVTLVRDQIPLEESAAKSKIIEVPDTHGGTVRLGVIDLPSFYATFDVSSSRDKPEPKSTTTDVAILLDKLKRENVAGVILDLRYNGGGSLEEAIKLTGLFIKTGPVVQVQDEAGNVQRAEDTDAAVQYDGPLVVLTSRHSASASEILAGALQDYGRALIVGDSSTHGKGTVQSVNQLRPNIYYADKSLTNDPGALKVTIKEFFRPSGISTQLKGVIPDIVLPSVANESKDIGESALDNPLPPDKISSAKYDHFNLVEPYLPELRKRSTERIAADKEYAYVREDIALFKKQQADKTLSLNEKQRLKEQDEVEARVKARDKERLARPEPLEKVYELTLKQAALPGLPPPVAKTNAALAKLSAQMGPGITGASSNSAVAAISAAPGEDTLDEAEAEKPAAQDAPLTEAKHILIDYLSVLPRGNLVKAGH
jgi:C-terminal peptidase prc